MGIAASVGASSSRAGGLAGGSEDGGAGRRGGRSSMADDVKKMRDSIQAPRALRHSKICDWEI